MGAPAPSPADKDIIEAFAEVEKFVFNVENKVLHPAMHGFEDAADGIRLARAGSALNDGADKKRMHLLLQMPELPTFRDYAASTAIWAASVLPMPRRFYAPILASRRRPATGRFSPPPATRRRPPIICTACSRGRRNHEPRHLHSHRRQALTAGRTFWNCAARNWPPSAPPGKPACALCHLA
jgi:hypothetical protein